MRSRSDSAEHKTQNAKRKILMLSSSYPKFPGDVTAPFIEAIAQGTQTQGFAVTVVMPHHPELRRQPLENGVRLLAYKYAPFKKWYLWGYAASLQGDVRIKKVIYLLLPLVLLTSFWKIWRLTGREQFDVIQAHWVIPNAPVAILIGWLRHIPVVISLHGSDVYVAERIKPVGWVARWAFSRAAAVTASSPDLLTRAQRLGAPTEPQRALFIPYGANLISPTPNPQPPIPNLPSEALILLSVGRLVYKKGFEYAIRALPAIVEKFPAAHFIIAGKGDLEAELKTIAAQSGVSEKVHFVGAVAHNLIPAYLAATDVFLLPSVVDDKGNVDGLPNTLLEAMAAGRTIVAAKVAGVPEVIKDGQNGRLVPQRDVAALAQTVIELLADAPQRARLGAAARATIVNELSWPSVVARYCAVFEFAIQEHK